jgi:hypothetical protein
MLFTDEIRVEVRWPRGRRAIQRLTVCLQS